MDAGLGMGIWECGFVVGKWNIKLPTGSITLPIGSLEVGGTLHFQLGVGKWEVEHYTARETNRKAPLGALKFDAFEWETNRQSVRGITVETSVLMG